MKWICFALAMGAAVFSVPTGNSGVGCPAFASTARLGRRSANWSKYYVNNLTSTDWANLKSDIMGYVASGFGPNFVRLAWIDCSSYNIADDSGGPHAQMWWNPVKGVFNTDLAVIDFMRAKYPGISRADLMSFAAAVSVSNSGGPVIQWRPGRADAVDSLDQVPEPKIGPLANSTDPTDLRAFFTARLGFDDRGIVTLLGAHSLGNAHVQVSGYAGPWTSTPLTFTNEYFNLLLANSSYQLQNVSFDGPPATNNTQYVDKVGHMMLFSDMALTRDSVFNQMVAEYAGNTTLFFQFFQTYFARLLEVGVSSGLSSTFVDTVYSIKGNATVDLPSTFTCYPKLTDNPIICISSEADGLGNTIFTVHSRKPGWAACGVGSTSMENGDVIIGWRNSSGGSWTQSLRTFQHGISVNSNSGWQQIPLQGQTPPWAKISYSAVHPNVVSSGDPGISGNDITDGRVIFAVSSYPPVVGNIDALNGVTTFFQHEVSGILGNSTASGVSRPSNGVIIASVCGSIGGLLIVFGSVLYCLWRRRKVKERNVENTLAPPPEEPFIVSSNDEVDAWSFSHSSVHEVAENDGAALHLADETTVTESKGEKRGLFEVFSETSESGDRFSKVGKLILPTDVTTWTVEETAQWMAKTLGDPRIGRKIREQELMARGLLSVRPQEYLRALDVESVAEVFLIMEAVDKLRSYQDGGTISEIGTSTSETGAAPLPAYR